MAKIKNVLSLVLVFAMLLTMASFPAFAADVPQADRAEAKTHILVPNAAGDKFTVANGEEVLVGDKIALPYLNTKNPQPGTLLKGGVVGDKLAAEATHAGSDGTFGLEGLYQNIFVYGEIGGVTYTAAKGNAYINSKASDNELNGATSEYAKYLTFTVTEVGTYNFKSTFLAADVDGDGVYGEAASANTYANADGKSENLPYTFDCVDPITVSRKLKVEPTYAKKTINLVYDASKNMYTVPEGMTVRVGDTLKWDQSQLFTYTKLDGTGAQQKALFASGLGAFYISLDSNGDGKFTRAEGQKYANYRWVAAGKDKEDVYSAQDLQVEAGYLVITEKGLYAGAKAAWGGTNHINPAPEGDPVYEAWYSTTEKNCMGVWLEPFKVTQVADDYANVAPTSDEVLEVPVEELLIGENATEFTLSFRVKMANDVEPEFTYSVAPTSEDITRVGAISGGGYEYVVDAKFPISGTSGDAVTVKVTWGDNFLCEEREYATFTRELSDQLFGAEFLEGENRLAVSTTTPALNANVLISVTTQKLKEGVTSAVVDGVTYTNLEIKLAEVKSSGNRFNDFTAEDFYYDVFTDTTRYLATAKKAGIDIFTAKLELVGYDAVAKKNVTLETVTLTTDMIKVPEKAPAAGINKAKVVGTTKVPQLIAQLQEVYADHDYVIVDCRNEYLVDINGAPILDEQNQPIANLAYRRAGDDPSNIIVTAELWNALIHMNKAYIEFRMHATVYEGGNAYTGQILKYDIKIDKKNTSLLLESKEELFRVGMVYGKTVNDKVTGSYQGVLDGVKEQLGNGYEPFVFRLSWWITGLPFMDSEVTIQIPEEWAKKNGYKDLSIYKFSPLNEGGIGTLSLYQDGLAVNNRTEYMITIPMSSDPSYFYGNYALVGADLTVERNNDTSGKNNAATGGADMVATFATFAVIALAGVALKKRED